jgi:hypothetical protein
MNRKQRRSITREIGKLQKRLKQREFTCLFPGCKEPAINSHSQQKEGQLRVIAKEGVVYALERNYYRSLKSGLTLIPTGISKASTFPGFCGNHDKEIFWDLENRALKKGDYAQASLLFLRTISYEYAQKRKGTIWLENFIKITRGIIEPELTRATTYLKEGMKHFVDFDGPFYLNAAFDALEKNPDLLVTEWEIITKNLMASCCCCFSPLLDDHVDYKIEHPNEPGPVVMFNLIPEENHSHIIVSWHKQDSKHTAWIKESMAVKASLERFINECAIVESEDTCLNPDLWKSTPHEVQAHALHAMRKSEFRGPLIDCPLVIKV